MEGLKRSVYIILSIWVVFFLIRFAFKLVVYLIPVIVVVYIAFMIKKFIENKLSNKSKKKKNIFNKTTYKKTDEVEVVEGLEDFSVENAIEVEYEDVK